MADLYRKSFVEKLSSPEQLDKSIRISSPMSRLALIGVALIIAATLLWSVKGVLPTTRTADGILVSTDSTGAFYCNAYGTVTDVYVTAGKKVNVGDDIVGVKSLSGETHVIKADASGVITKVLVQKDSELYSGAEVARFTPSLEQDTVVVCFVSLSEAKLLQTGMKVLLYPTALDSQKYGHMEATIHSIGAYSADADNLKYVLGADTLIAEQFTANGPVVAVSCTIKTDSSTKSGYYWSSENGELLTVSNGTLLSAKIVIEENAPITKLFNNLKEKLEG